MPFSAQVHNVESEFFCLCQTLAKFQLPRPSPTPQHRVCLQHTLHTCALNEPLERIRQSRMRLAIQMSHKMPTVSLYLQARILNPTPKTFDSPAFFFCTPFLCFVHPKTHLNCHSRTLQLHQSVLIPTFPAVPLN